MYSIRLELGREAEDRSFERKKKEINAKRIQEEKQHRKKMWYLQRITLLCGVFLVFVIVVVALVINIRKLFRDDVKESEAQVVASDEVSVIEQMPIVDTTFRDEMESIRLEEEAKKASMYHAENAQTMIELGADVLSEYAIVLDNNSNEIVSSRNGRTRISPASMTKILTLLVAVENIDEDDLEDTFTITSDITYYAYRHDCSAVGFLDDEVVTVRDLLYGTILPSGGDAALALATYVAGSQEDFVELMNKKLDEMGLSETAHFTNCVGLFDEDHYCTCYDMAMILHAAIENELCKEVLSARIYTTSQTEQHPNGIEISNWFLRRIEDKDIGGEVMCAKTGYVNQSGNCAASYATDGNGHDYIAVTGNAPGSWKCIYDHVRIYRQFFPAYNGEYVNATDEADEANNEDADEHGNG